MAPSRYRSDPSSAERFFRECWPDKSISRACARNLADSVRAAHTAGPASWSITLFTKFLRLNVGQVETFTLETEGCRFFFRSPLGRTAGLDVIGGTKPCFKAVPLPSGICFIPAERMTSVPARVRKAHDEFIRAAAVFKSRSPFRKSLSLGVVEYLEQTLGEQLPRPAYLPHIEPPPDEVEADEELGAFEGKARRLFVVHRHRERRLRDNKLKAARQEGALRCEVPRCGFEFEKIYGELGAGFAEVHHRRPLGGLKRSRRTTLDDLAVVCANCHRMIHKGGKCRPLATLIP
jgi:hypothetical protein